MIISTHYTHYQYRNVSELFAVLKLGKNGFVVKDYICLDVVQ